MSDVLRITGLATGIDTDQMIKDLMKVENIKVDKAKQERQYLVWQRDAYREISNLLRGFKDEYFDVLKPETNFMSSSMFKAYEATAKVNGIVTSAVTVEATSSALLGTHKLEQITQLATKDTWTSSDKVSSGLTGAAVNLAGLNNGDTFDLTLDGVKKTITLEKDYGSLTVTQLKDDLQVLIDNAFGAGNITVIENGGTLTFEADGHTLVISDTNTGDTTVSDLGFTSGDKNIFDLNKTLDSNVEFTINGITFSFDTSYTYADIINEVNSSDANVTLSYSSLTDKFTLQANQEGAVNNISLSDVTGNLLTGTFKLINTSQGQDAIFKLDGVTTTRSSNTFTIDGVTYTLNSTYTDVNPIDITISSNPDDLIEKIKGFVEKYNEVISTINGKLSEKKYYDYKPLTDAQKDEMTEKEIELWEEKAKSGILRSDSILEGIVNDMRTALYDSVEGVGISLYDIGITTSSNYKDRGKLVINEEKLRQALEDRPQDVMNLFAKESDIDYSDTSNRAQRYNEEGLAHRLYDILQDNIRTTRDSNGRKGLLLEKAGIENDVTEYNNVLNEKISDYDEMINELLDELADKENYYYTMFARMERAIQQMNNQSAWLMGQLGGGM
ncbi:flagellar filament capping protein FliD [Caloranaerobacter ferrireducens]|uniref:flagellar filament capping protein FliD n=1 Tax=Caloranaerobacter ferrireducens TaxID=1323370 RepID=UPI00084CF395|nr:flagellar filament capping protein FliD [Caloranaerobacter ferrireducens]